MSNSSGDLAIAICGRCNKKLPYKALGPDPNMPGIRVCKYCTDEKDPYRLPSRQPEPLTLKYPRPDTNLSVTHNDLIYDDEEYIVTEDLVLIRLGG